MGSVRATSPSGVAEVQDRAVTPPNSASAAEALRARLHSSASFAVAIQSVVILTPTASFMAASFVPPDKRASLPVFRVRLDAAYTRIGAVIRRANSTFGHGLFCQRRGGFPSRRISARMGAKPDVECGWRVARWTGSPQRWRKPILFMYDRHLSSLYLDGTRGAAHPHTLVALGSPPLFSASIP